MKIVLPKKGTGIFIPDITVEMFRNAPLEFVEELLTEGEMSNIDIEEMKLLAYQRGLLQMREAIDETLVEIPCMEVLQNKWIPVSEELPEENLPVLVAVKQKDRLLKRVKEQTYSYVTDIDVCDDGNFDRHKNKVVAWQPLPEPYEEREEK